MEEILRNLYDLIDMIVKSDPAVYRVMLYDNAGNEIYQYAKTWNQVKKYTSVGAMISQIFKNADKFLGFMKRDFYSKFVFQWYFEDVVIIAADTTIGFIAILCENDVDLGFVKNILMKQGLKVYEKIMTAILE